MQRKILKVWAVLCLLSGLILSQKTQEVFAAAPTDASITGCEIVSNEVVISGTASNGITTDGKLYLFALETYEEDADLEGKAPLAAVNAASSFSFTVPLEQETAASVLFSKFVVGVKTGEDAQGNAVYDLASNSRFITNPEACAQQTLPFPQVSSKKGLMTHFYMVTDYVDLGIHHAAVTVRVSDFFNTASYGTCYYQFEGETYTFSNYHNQLLGGLRNLADAGAVVSLVIVNDYNPAYEYLTYPGVTGGANYYAFNTEDEEGTSAYKAFFTMLGEAYNGIVWNWIVGNEVNNNIDWNYMGLTDQSTHVSTYARTFRIAYTALKSVNANDRVYISLDHSWSYVLEGKKYATKDYINEFAACLKQQGDIDWSLAFHAYSFPLNEPEVWDDGAAIGDAGGGEISYDENTFGISMKNIEVLTDYFQREHLLNPNGEVRHIILSEQGYTSVSKSRDRVMEQEQAASIVYAYYKTEANRYLDAIIFNRQVDASDMGNSYYQFGLWNSSSNASTASTKKYSWRVFKYMDTAQSLAETAFARNIIGISDWSQIAPGFDSAVYGTMPSITEGNGNVVTGLTGTEAGSGWTSAYNCYGSGNHFYLSSGNHFSNYKIVRQDCSIALYSDTYIGFQIKVESDNYSIGAADVCLRLYSGESYYEAAVTVPVNQTKYVAYDLGNWPERSNITSAEVWVIQHGIDQTWTGAMTIGNLHIMAEEPAVYTLPFQDVNQNAWYYPYVDYVYSENIMQGVGNMQFQPDSTMTRAMAVVVLYRMEGAPAVTYSDLFGDVPDGQWYTDAVMWASANGIAQGYGENYFGANDFVTREQFVTMLYRYASRYTYTDYSISLNQFDDAEQISDWAVDAFQWAVHQGVIRGITDSLLVPTGLATRAEAAKMLSILDRMI